MVFTSKTECLGTGNSQRVLHFQENEKGKFLATLIFRFSIFYLTVMALFTSGCAVNEDLIGKANESIMYAQIHISVAESLKVQQIYPDNFAKAKDELTKAREYLSSEYLTNKKLETARQAADSSTELSDDILKRYYREKIVPKASEIKQKILDKAKLDSDTPLIDRIPELDDIMKYNSELETKRKIEFLDRIGKNILALIGIENIIDIEPSKLESDVSFELGSDILSLAGKLRLEEEAQKIISDKDTYKGNYPDSTVTVKTKIVGYTDSVGFNEKNRSSFRWKLTPEEEDMLPPHDQPEQRRNFLNQCLSKRRAKSVSNYLEELILNSEGKDSKVNVDSQVEGNGEKYPPNIEVSGANNDPLRRICKIYSYCMVH